MLQSALMDILLLIIPVKAVKDLDMCYYNFHFILRLECSLVSIFEFG